MSAFWQALLASSGQQQRRGLLLDGQQAYLELGSNNHPQTGSAWVLEVAAQLTNLNQPVGDVILARNNTPQDSAFYELAFKGLNGGPYARLSLGMWRPDIGDFRAFTVPISVADYQNKAVRYIAINDLNTLFLYVVFLGGPLQLLGSMAWNTGILIASGNNLIGAVALSDKRVVGMAAGYIYDVRYWSVVRSTAELERYAWQQLPNSQQQYGLELYHKLNDPVGSTQAADSARYGEVGTIHNASITALASPIHLL